jgi:hypothetical protein
MATVSPKSEFTIGPRTTLVQFGGAGFIQIIAELGQKNTVFFTYLTAPL